MLTGVIVAVSSILALNLVLNQNETRPWTLRSQRASALRWIGAGFAAYRTKFRVYPTSGEALLRSEVIKSSLICPACGNPFTFLIDSPGFYTPTGGQTYTWDEHGVTDRAPLNLPVVDCEGCPGKYGEWVVLLFDGRLDLFAADSSTGTVLAEMAARRHSWKAAH